VRLAVVAPLQQASPFGVSWQEVLEHTAQRLAWTDPAFRLAILDSADLAAAGDNGGSPTAQALQAELARSQAAVAVGVADPAAAAALAPLLAGLPTAVALGSAQQLAPATRLGGRQPAPPPAAAGGPLAALLSLPRRLFPDKQAELDGQVLHTVEELFQRGSSDDFLFIFLVGGWLELDGRFECGRMDG
jgi:hypothetical protein